MLLWKSWSLASSSSAAAAEGSRASQKSVAVAQANMPAQQLDNLTTLDKITRGTYAVERTNHVLLMWEIWVLTLRQQHYFMTYRTFFYSKGCYIADLSPNRIHIRRCIWLFTIRISEFSILFKSMSENANALIDHCALQDLVPIQ